MMTTPSLVRPFFVMALGALLGCGQGSSGSMPEPTPLNENGETFDLSEDSQESRIVPLGMVPSQFEEGKWLPACKPGQAFVLDSCFDSVHIGARGDVTLRRAGQVDQLLITKDGTFHPTLKAQANLYDEGDGRHIYRIPWFKKWVEKGHGYSVVSLWLLQSVETAPYQAPGKAKEFWLNTLFAFDDMQLSLNPKKEPQFLWQVEGTIEVCGQTLALTAALPEFENACGIFFDREMDFSDFNNLQQKRKNRDADLDSNLFQTAIHGLQFHDSTETYSIESWSSKAGLNRSQMHVYKLSGVRINL